MATTNHELLFISIFLTINLIGELVQIETFAQVHSNSNITNNSSSKNTVAQNAQHVNENNNIDDKQKNLLPDNESNNSDVESGAVIRGILVFVGIGLIFIVYIACKTYRRNKMPIIKKYGVRGRKSDVEMKPLPLDDDEDDETVFDLGNLNKP
ncbi:uncharacterized protein LOC130895966 [Diorhabda carinulata]|uniref:uncharacterized protein LOC130895966 n=1 Tax=Diorhabda carinulata TaxID=1163345 RepID=UPI0025A2D78D|nr:uncharacterized protein LOC130895966 [Diorhabda carinulata]